MVNLRDDNIIFSKYLDTDIDSVCVHFARNNEATLVGEYELPDSYKYIVFVGARKDETFPDFIEVANYNELKKVIDKDKNCIGSQQHVES